jgi:hypothetical protein
MRDVLTLEIELGFFGSPGGLQLPTFGGVNFILTLIPKWGCDIKSPKIPKIGSLAILKAHNFFCKPSIEVRFKPKF